MWEQIISSVGNLFICSHLMNPSSIIHHYFIKKKVRIRFSSKISLKISYSRDINLGLLSTKSDQNFQNVVYLLLS